MLGAEQSQGRPVEASGHAGLVCWALVGVCVCWWVGPFPVTGGTGVLAACPPGAGGGPGPRSGPGLIQ